MNLEKLSLKLNNHIKKYENTCNEVYVQDHEKYLHIFLGGYRGDGFTQKKAKEFMKEISDLIGNEYFVAKNKFDYYDDESGYSRQLMYFIDIFPIYGNKIDPENIDGDSLYHIFPKKYENQIKAKGIVPKKGGSDFIKTVNSRIYLCSANSVYDVYSDLLKNRNEENYKIAIVPKNSLGTLYEDVEMPDCYWTENKITDFDIDDIENHVPIIFKM